MHYQLQHVLSACVMIGTTSIGVVHCQHEDNPSSTWLPKVAATACIPTGWPCHTIIVVSW